MTQIPNVTAGARTGFGEALEGGTYDPAEAAQGASPARGGTGTRAEAPGPADASLEPAATQSEAPPTGTIAEILAWVGSDQARAQAALDAEYGTGHPRSTLVAALDPIARG